MNGHKNPAITVIIPAYNVADFLGRAIKSIQAQTLEDWELIVVNDGSKDDTGAICDAFEAIDSRITVIHQDNAGAPAARNNGMKRATGDFLFFFDGDDWAETTMFEDMYALACSNNLQVVVAGFYIDTYYKDSPDIETEHFTQLMSCPGGMYDQVSFRHEAWKFFDKNLLYPPWNKMYSREYIQSNGIEFPNTFWDDFPFVLDVIRDVERIGVTPHAYYHFLRARSDSETAKYRADMYEKREEEHAWMVELYAHWGETSPQAQEMVSRRYAERLVGCIENMTNKSCTLTGKEIRSEIKKYLSLPHAEEALRNTHAKSRMMHVVLWPMIHKCIWMTYLESRVISYIKSHSTKIFARIKARR